MKCLLDLFNLFSAGLFYYYINIIIICTLQKVCLSAPMIVSSRMHRRSDIWNVVSVLQWWLSNCWHITSNTDTVACQQPVLHQFSISWGMTSQRLAVSVLVQTFQTQTLTPVAELYTINRGFERTLKPFPCFPMIIVGALNGTGQSCCWHNSTRKTGSKLLKLMESSFLCCIRKRQVTDIVFRRKKVTTCCHVSSLRES